MPPKTKTVLNTGMTKEEIVKTPEKKGSKAHASAVPESRKRAHDGFLEFTPDRPTKALRSPMAPERIPAQTQTSLESSPSDSENILLSGLKNLKLNPKPTASPSQGAYCCRFSEVPWQWGFSAGTPGITSKLGLACGIRSATDTERPHPWPWKIPANEGYNFWGLRVSGEGFAKWLSED